MVMEMAASMALCSSSPTTLCSSPHPSSCSVAEIEFNARVVATHHTSSKPVLAGLSGLFGSPSVRYPFCSAGDSLDASNAARRGSYSDPCSLWDGIESWVDAPSLCSSTPVKMRGERSPVSVLQGPLACSSGQSFGRLSTVMRDRNSGFFLLDQQPGNCSLAADVQQSLLRRCEEFRGANSALGSFVDEGQACDSAEQEHLGLSSGAQSSLGQYAAFSTEKGESYQETPPLSNSSPSELFCEPLFQERTAEDVLHDAQERHQIFKDPFVIKAFEEAEKAHHGQYRVSGDPYIVHCAETAMALAALGAGKVVVAAGLLHDTIDDTRLDYQDLQDLFGIHVADLVEGVSRLSEFSQLARDNNTASKTVEADRLHTMFLAMADVRVVLIKLADRLHNMRTLGALPQHKQYRIAKETLEIFTPLANRLGIWSWKAEMEDLCFKHLKPQEHQELSSKLADSFRETKIMSSIHKLDKALVEKGVMYHDLSGRPKNLYGIYSKMMRKDRSLEEIYDVRGLRLIVANERDCYTALETVHQLWPCIPGNLKDYIRQPKPNGYQSLHTVVRGEDGLPLEVQIRTKEMHHQAEFGVAAHWRYKEDNVQHSSFILEMVEWARWVLTWQSETVDTKLRLSPIEIDLRSPCPFPHHRDGCPHSQILQAPPQSEDDPLFVIILEDERMMVQEFPGGSTVADLLHKRFMEDSFAATCGVAFCEELRPRVNGKIVDDIQHRLKMGDLVEMTPLIPDDSLSKYREKIKRMFGDSVIEEEKTHTTFGDSVEEEEKSHTLQLFSVKNSQVAMA